MFLQLRSSKYHIIWVCVVALGIYHVMCMRHVVMWSARLYDTFPHCIVKGMIFGKTVLDIKCALGFSLQLSSETFFIIIIIINIKDWTL